MSMMHGLAAFVVLVALSSCAAISGVDATKLSRIEPGTSRQEAEQVLGDPTRTTRTKLGLAAVYSYNKGGAPVVDARHWAYFLFMPYLWPSAEHAAISRQTGIVTVLYDRNQRVVSAFEADQREVLRGIAEGDPKTLFFMGRLSPPGSNLQFLWYCYAAHGNHAVAQYLLAARFYEDGKGEIAQDPAKAYLWYSLASQNSDETAVTRLKLLERELRPGEIQQAQIRVTSWKPNAASCKDDVGNWEGDAETLDLLERLVGVGHS